MMVVVVIKKCIKRMYSRVKICFWVSNELNDSAMLFSEATRTLLYNAICWISQSDILAGFGWMTSG